MKRRHFILTLILLVSFFLTSCQNETVNVMKINTGSDFCDIEKYDKVNEYYTNNVIKFDFNDAQIYFNKFIYLQESLDEFYTYTIELSGNNIDVSYLVESSDGNYMKTTNDYNSLPKKTIYISTDLEYAIFSVPTVYENYRVLDSVQTIDYYEQPIDISYDEGIYYITYVFPKDIDVISEMFYIKSDVPLVTIDSNTEDLLIRTELSERFRFLEDGFYQISYENYFPTGDGNYFRNCANYIGSHFINYNYELSDENRVKYFDYFAYASTYIVDSMINENGFFETSSRSQWLYSDFLINAGFYDTRFNADNGELNITLYEQFSDDLFYDTLVKYGDFFINYALEHSYKTQRGILVEDYYNPDGGIRTHVSLNHQLANLNFLISLYDVTQEQKYLDIAILMLYGIEDTEDEWILDNNDLNYALFYTGSNNTMKDYPYLTYNDLFITRERLNNIDIESQTIQNLMDSKMKYMVDEGISGYLEY